MANINKVYAGQYLTASDVPTGTTRAMIISCGYDTKLGKVIVVCDGIPKPIALNKTNAKFVGETLGEETDNWVGHFLTVMRGLTAMQGRMVPCVQVVKAEKQVQQNGQQ